MPRVKKQQHNAHDRGYKDILSDKSMFLHLLKKYIDEPWVACIDNNDLEKVNKSFIKKGYGEIESDIIYKLKRDSSDVYFYVLLELQSEPDFTMVHRLLMYSTMLLDDIFKNTDKNIRERKDFRLPAVVPIVLYNGDDNWTPVRTYKEYIKNYELFGDSIIDFRYSLFDLKRMDDGKILSTIKLLDVILSLDKLLTRSFILKEDLSELSKRLEYYGGKLTREESSKLFEWVVNRVAALLDSKIKKQFKQSLEKGDKNDMKHGLEVMLEMRDMDVEMRRSRNIARNLLANGTMTVDEIAKATELDILEVIRLQSDMA